MRKNSLWLIIWRFQPFHIGHELLVQKSLQENPVTLILIGSSNIENIENPWSYEKRKEMIQDFFISQKFLTQLSISPLPDFPDDTDWIQEVLLHIPDNIQYITLYCGDTSTDSAVKVLKEFESSFFFELSIVEIPRSHLPISGTKVRELLEEWDTQNIEKYLRPEVISLLEK